MRLDIGIGALRCKTAIWIAAILFWALGVVSMPGASAASRINRVVELRCEGIRTPLATDARQPRLSWKYNSRIQMPRGTEQAAARVIVGTSEAKVRAGGGDVWESGWIWTSVMAMKYEAPTLKPETTYWWSVEVRNTNRTAMGRSAPAHFVTATSTWTSRWIEAPWSTARDGSEMNGSRPMPVFRRAFAVRDTGSQTANAMPLALGIVPNDKQGEVLQHVIADLRAHDDHVTTGEVGFPYLVRALTEQGRSDEMLALMLHSDPPSYGSQLVAGATALTEAWNANPKNSQDHFMLGGGEEWFYRGLGGIDLDMSRGPSARITIRPQMVEGVSWVRCGYASTEGRIESDWARQRGRTSMEVTIPIGAEATIVVPASGNDLIRESGRPAEDAPYVRLIRRDTEDATYEVRSGSYHFSVTPAAP